MPIVLGELASGELVYDRSDSHLHQGVLPYVSYALSQMEMGEGVASVKETVRFPETIGASHLVKTGSGDVIVFAKRELAVKGKWRHWHSRCAPHRNPTPTDEVTLVVRRIDASNAELVTAYFGRPGQPEPGDPRACGSEEAAQASWLFWQHHALAVGFDELDDVRSESPWCYPVVLPKGG